MKKKSGIRISQDILAYRKWQLQFDNFQMKPTLQKIVFNYKSNFHDLKIGLTLLEKYSKRNYFDQSQQVKAS